jgi:hypothetical protein
MPESFLEREIATTQEIQGEVRLWQAVIVKTIEAWLSGPLRQKRQAESYLFDDKKDFPLVCQAAGLNPEDMRARLTKIRNRNLQSNPSEPREDREYEENSLQPALV